MKVKECMSNIVNTVKPDATVSDCAKMMCERHIGCVPVCNDERKVVGILTDRDILLRAVACDKDASNTKVSDIMSTKVFCCDCESEVEEAEKNFRNRNQVRKFERNDNKFAQILKSDYDISALERDILSN